MDRGAYIVGRLLQMVPVLAVLAVLVFMMSGLAHGDLGSSFIVRVPVLQLVQERLPLTLFLVAYAMTLAVALTFPLALLAALHRDSILDQVVRGFTVAMMSTPGF